VCACVLPLSPFPLSTGDDDVYDVCGIMIFSRSLKLNKTHTKRDYFSTSIA